MKKILLTNDDGFDSLGLLSLAEALRPLGEVTIVAPTLEKSACGHSLTLTKPLRFVELEEGFFKLDDGTPTDCVFLALHKLYDAHYKPDIVISGINKGANMGEDITYSGTASGAMEAVLQGVPAIAISQVCKEHCQNIDTLGYALAKKSIHTLVQKIFDGEFPLPERKFLNVNIPPISVEACQGFKITRAGNRIYGNDAEVHHNPRGLEYYWIGLPNLEWRNTPGGQMTDFEAVNQDYVSITPIHLDMTSYDDIEALEQWV
ncbi:MAG TPA: 5'/3'-nucleotidase SurE [Campylobacterales bacterium]|nr:5'/3'-nucleotidase SurE [Campylobacterales bacterium]